MQLFFMIAKHFAKRNIAALFLPERRRDTPSLLILRIQSFIVSGDDDDEENDIGFVIYGGGDEYEDDKGLCLLLIVVLQIIEGLQKLWGNNEIRGKNE